MKTILRNLSCGWICFWLAFHPAISIAEQPDPAPLQQGQVAPFNGVLIPTLKAAEMTVKLEQADSLCLTRIDAAVAAAVNKSQLLLNNCSDSKKIMEKMYKTQLEAQGEYIDFLEKKASAPGISKEWVFIIGIVAGVGITIGAGYAMNSASK